MTSFSLLINLLFSLLIITQFPVTTCHGCHEQDRRALLDFKSSLADPGNRLSSWQDSYRHQNCCNWHGVVCSDDSFRVISVDLRNRDLEVYEENHDATVKPNTSLTGRFSPSLFRIRHLEYIDLAINDFQETQIPLELSNLTKLSHLDLSNSNIGSSISSQFSNLSSLHHLDLSGNYYLQSPSTKWLTGLVNLLVLKLRGIDFYEAASSEGKFAGHISPLSNLRDLDLSDCSISSTTFPNFHNLSFLSSLKMSDNSDFNFSIPAQLTNLTSLSTLELSRCDLQGSIPYLPQLKELDVSGNQYLEVDLTRMFQLQWPKLETLDISETYKSGLIPVSISNAPMLVSLSAHRCSIQGSLPSSLYNLSRLESLYLSGNNITGYIHSSSISNLKFLDFLDLSDNKLQGSIPSAISNLKFLDFLRLSDNNLQGSIPESISNLKFLDFLDLCNNNLQGTIPKSISNLQSLNILDLSINKIQGSIPSSICKIVSLRRLSLDNNNITGTIPSCISKLYNLTVFSVYDNSIEGSVSLILLIKDLEITTIELSSDRLDVRIDRNLRLYSKFKLKNLALPPGSLKGLFPTICKLNYLGDLILSHSQLTGVIPSCICKLKNLNTLDLSQNHLTGVIPSCISNLKKLEILDLSHNQLTGVFPSCVKLKNLNILDLSQNHLTGVIPSCISNLKKLEIFNVSSNNFYGHLPLPPQTVIFDASNNKLSGEFSLETGIKISRFQVINLAGNELSGSIPSSICSKHSDSSLQIIDLSNNKFSGVIPDTIGYCRDLRSLNLGSNNLIGNVPNEIRQLESLGYLQLQDNRLDGIPLKFIGKLQRLVVLNLANNHFDGNIPTALFGAPQYSPIIRIISLRSNKFSGSIPNEIYSLDLLQILDLSHNKLTGNIPKQIGGYWMNLAGNPELFGNEFNVQLQMVINGIMVQFQKMYTYNSGLDLSCNMLDGTIPTEIGQLDGLARLNLSHNHFSYNIPASIGNMSNLVSLDLSFNRLSGKIPQTLASLDSLGVLNLSYNELSGKITKGNHFDTLGADGWAFVGNALLCGEPTKNVCEVAEDDQEDDPEDPNEKLILYSIVSLGFVVGFWGLFFVMLIKKEKWWFPYWRLIDSVVAVIISCIQNKF